eukprot:Pgem_evm1s12467
MAGFLYEIEIVQANETSTNAIGFAELIVYDKNGQIDLSGANATSSSYIRDGGYDRTPKKCIDNISDSSSNCQTDEGKSQWWSVSFKSNTEI